MVDRVGGFRRKTRGILRKDVRTRGKISLTRFFQKFEAGQHVVLKAEPAYQRGMYLPRFHGTEGVVTGMQGKCYQVRIKDGGMTKNIVVHPIHLKAV